MINIKRRELIKYADDGGKICIIIIHQRTRVVSNRKNMRTYLLYIRYYKLRLPRRYIIILFIIIITTDFFPRQLSKTQLYREIVQVKCVEKMENMHRTQSQRVKNESVRNAIKTRP